MLIAQVGLRQGQGGPLIGFISAVPVKVSIYGEVKDTAEINFFVLHSDARGKRSGNTNLARVIITEITRRCYKSGIRLALYTGAQEMPHAMSRTAYYHRKINVPKLVSTGFSSLPDGMTLEEHYQAQTVPDTGTLTWPGMCRNLRLNSRWGASFNSHPGTRSGNSGRKEMLRRAMRS